MIFLKHKIVKMTINRQILQLCLHYSVIVNIPKSQKNFTKQDNLLNFGAGGKGLLIKNDPVLGVLIHNKINFYSRSVVLATGTFLGGKIHIGLNSYSAGRIGGKSSIDLSERSAPAFSIERPYSSAFTPAISANSLPACTSSSV